MRNLICKNCGTPFQAGKGNFKFCPTCRLTATKRRNATYSRRPEEYDTCPVCSGFKYKPAQMCIHCRRKISKGDKHPNWKGGRFIDTKRGGYVFIRIGKHYIPEHRHIWEQAHNQKLPNHYIVHHLNGVKSDNRPENLIALPRQYHPANTWIKALQTRIRELEQLRLPI